MGLLDQVISGVLGNVLGGGRGSDHQQGGGSGGGALGGSLSPIVQALLMFPQFVFIVFGGMQVLQLVGVAEDISRLISVPFALFCLLSPYYSQLTYELPKADTRRES